jgi:DNA-binding response OmpR family regulator
VTRPHVLVIEDVEQGVTMFVKPFEPAPLLARLRARPHPA